MNKANRDREREPLSEGELDAIMERFAGSERAYDAGALRAEIERLCDKLTDCWLWIDSIARGPVPRDVHNEAQWLLRKQKAPGWT